MSEHLMAGRMSGLTGTVTYCECGLAFFAGYEGGKETDATRRAAMEQADEKWRAHADASRNGSDDACSVCGCADHSCGADCDCCPEHRDPISE